MDDAATELPDNVVKEIISRLLPRSIVTGCRAVCKAWRRLTSQPAFYRANTIPRPRPVAAKVTVKNTTRGAGSGVAGGEDAIVRFDLFRSHWNPRVLSLGTATDISLLVLGSWDGVLCMAMTDGLMVYVLWNPLTNACATVSAPISGGHFVGAYTNPATRRFHLLHATGKTDNDDLMAPAIFRVRTVGDAAWRVVPSRPPKITMAIHDVARPVALHGKLHWLVQSGRSAAGEKVKLKLPMFDAVQQKFRLMEAPERMGTSDLSKARVSVLSAGELCAFAVVRVTSEMDMWVLDDYANDRRSWQLKKRIKLVIMKPCWHNLSHEFTMDARVKVVQGADEEGGEEVFVHTDGRVDAYSFRCERWRAGINVSVAGKVHVSVVRHEHSVLPLPHEVSFGAASRVLSRSRSLHAGGQCCYRL